MIFPLFPSPPPKGFSNERASESANSPNPPRVYFRVPFSDPAYIIHIGSSAKYMHSSVETLVYPLIESIQCTCKREAGSVSMKEKILRAYIFTGTLVL